MAAQISISRGARSRRAILDAAYRLIIRQGFAATSMRQIAAQSHVALGGIYNHFSSKEQIFRAIVEERHPFFQIIPMLQAVQGDTVEAFVRNAAHTLVDQLGHHPDFLNLMLTEIVEFKARHVPALYGRFFPLIAPLAERIRAIDDHVRAIPGFVLGRAFLGMFFSYYITEILLARTMPPELAAGTLDHFVDIFLRGILEEPQK